MREIKWLVKPRIILAYSEGSQDIDDVRLNNQEIKALLDAGQAPVHLVFQAVNLKNSPTNIQELKNSLDFLRHPNLGWIISVGSNPILNFVSTIVTNLFRINLRQANSLEDAIDWLKQLDPSIETVH
jgi:hypothetical protein